jgi:uncharacterized protein YdhG (YjbR/CyaY superfamily)
MEEANIIDLTSEEGVLSKADLFGQLSTEQFNQLMIDLALDNLHESIAKDYDEIKFLQDHNHNSLEERANVVSSAPEAKKKLRSHSAYLTTEGQFMVDSRISSLHESIGRSFATIENFRKRLHGLKMKQAKLLNQIIELELHPKPMDEELKKCIYVAATKKVPKVGKKRKFRDGAYDQTEE